ncbi:DUF779 domain-containing protein [Mycobacterium shigaense]|uniref:DUF779 domain-containing protein n=1 Tax=Mycobacterium shigaense TaxID=722731 RepID=UPI002ADF1F8E|nr:DUF779 domain-containing protein [Mycobacterium shigaense]MEA1122294.1 DUF779 domain-containing protein [Mycobacterium shigaense]
MRVGDDAERSDEEEWRHYVVPAPVVVTAAAAELLTRLQDRHGPVMFHQSRGCCDGSSPMCYPVGDFLVGDRDVLLGVLDVAAPGSGGVPVWISGPQYRAWKHTQLVIDIVPGRGGGFSLEAPEGVRFLSRGRVFTDDEKAQLAAAPVITGAGYERGERPAIRGPVVGETAPETCPAGPAEPQ